jgi:hypothetical protein
MCVEDTRVKRELLTCPGDGWRDVRSSRWDPPAEVSVKHSLQYIYIRTPTRASRRLYLRSHASKTRPANPRPPRLCLAYTYTCVISTLYIVILYLLRIRCFSLWNVVRLHFTQYDRIIKFQYVGILTCMEGHLFQNYSFRKLREILLN